MTHRQSPDLDTLTVAEVLPILRYSNPEPVHRLIRSGALKARKVGRQYLISKSSLAAFINP